MKLCKKLHETERIDTAVINYGFTWRKTVKAATLDVVVPVWYSRIMERWHWCGIGLTIAYFARSGWHVKPWRFAFTKSKVSHA